MSNILIMKKEKLIKIPNKIKIKINDNRINFEGPLGSSFLFLNDKVELKIENNNIIISLLNPKYKKFLGLYSSLINKKIEGVLFGFKCVLILKGVGYKAEIVENNLILKLGYSHEIKIIIPDGIKIIINNNTILNLYGIDLNNLTQFASYIKKYRLPEPYKGKGILFKNEIILRKEGKKSK